MTRKSARLGAKRVLELEVTLLGVEPEIWRRVHVASDTRLDELHSVIQAAMGWQDEHEHQFSLSDPALAAPGEMAGESDMTVGSLLKKRGQALLYEYDFADCWTHEIRLEAVSEPEPGVTYPLCAGGERACPPEGSGGVDAYADLFESGEGEAGFDPEEFSVKAANKALRARRRPAPLDEVPGSV